MQCANATRRQARLEPQVINPYEVRTYRVSIQADPREPMSESLEGKRGK